MPAGFERETPPEWDLSGAYAGFESPGFVDNKRRLAAVIGEIEDELEAWDADLGAASPRFHDAPEARIRACITRFNEAFDLFDDLYAYTYARFSVNTRDETSQKEINRLESVGVALTTSQVRFRSALLRLEAGSDPGGSGALAAAIGRDPALGEFSFYLGEQAALARKQMSVAEESLAADLGRDGGEAWGRLQQAVSSTLSAVWDETSGERKTVTELRALAFDRDRAVRAKAYAKELEAWRSVEIPLAFALNGVKGFSVTLNARRRYADTLERSMIQARMSRASLDALIRAMTNALPMFRRYLAAKARALGLDRLAFYDLFAPVGSSTRPWPFSEAGAFIVEQLSGFSVELGAFAADAFAAHWIDARPREGKVGGGYCVSFPLSKSSRILCNYDDSFDALSTVAHELGHAYHHHVLRDAPAIHRNYPMTLAETASIFTENLVFSRALESATEAERVTILDGFLVNATQVIVDILSRFFFEREVFSRRKDGELSPRELCELMLDAQEKTYGDALAQNERHPYMWAVKGHYYSPDLAFYNFPYAFGQLFGMGIFALSQREPDGFANRYRELLQNTGRMSAVELTRNVGFDIEKQDFWNAGLAMIEERVVQFEQLVGT